MKAVMSYVGVHVIVSKELSHPLCLLLPGRTKRFREGRDLSHSHTAARDGIDPLERALRIWRTSQRLGLWATDLGTTRKNTHVLFPSGGLAPSWRARMDAGWREGAVQGFQLSALPETRPGAVRGHVCWFFPLVIQAPPTITFGDHLPRTHLECLVKHLLVADR